MSRSRRLLLLLSTLVLLLAACGGGEGSGSSTSSEPVAEPSAAGTASEPSTAGAASEVAGGGELLIWADDTRKPALEEFAASFGEENGVDVVIEEKVFDDLRGEFTTAAPAGEGPDIVIGAHDWLGEFVSAGVVAPVDLGATADDFQEVAIQAMTFDGQLYGVPYAVENVALFRNTDHVPEAPETFEELVETAQQLEADGEVESGFLIPTNPPDPYHNYPMFTAEGGYVFAFEEGEGYDADDLGIDSEGGIAAARQFDEWVKSGFLKTNVEGALMQDQFADGNAAFVITGPWALVQDGRGFEETGVPFEVSPIPPLDGGTPEPFVGVQSFMVSAFAENPLVAQTFVTQEMTTEEAQMALFEANRRPPALTSAQEQIADDPVFQAFAESGAEGNPLPAIPEMGSVWDAWTNAYGLIYAQDSAPEDAFDNAAEQIRNLIEGN